MATDPYAALEAFLRRDFDTYRTLSAEADNRELARALASVFFVAMDDKFGAGSTSADIIAFVASARARFDDTGDKVDPAVAEKLIRAAAFDEDLPDGIDPQAQGSAETVLLAALADQDGWTDEHAIKLIAEARNLA
ncbi:hypothetical protein [Actinocatenispora rupis]|uniref:Uncharacterized protein n=1 Tax=Actinocatenispora rupis TaxID=519421 RepID=A0A8J3IYH2_9ACTN|nr:hypothetical protein [Actinocatenispora rupis]GID12371.1 hypothetical protein Aru02nite_32600 [Actinocatenispora rupis]